MALAAIAGGVVLAVGATSLMAEGGEYQEMRVVDRQEVRVEVRKVQKEVERVRDRGDRMRDRAQHVRVRAHVADGASAEARVQAMTLRARIQEQVRQQIDEQVARGDRADVQWQVRMGEDFDFDFNFDFDFEAGELRMHLEGIEGLEDLTLDLTDLELRLEGLGEQISGELQWQLDGLDEELERRLEDEMRRLEEELGRVRVEVRGR